ncbi:MAG TPA: hypothetical protein PLD54_04380 [Candidatus Levybacteria bacterium]|nr:hypothetical protein [Candidatus Levybacteria bacterium]
MTLLGLLLICGAWVVQYLGKAQNLKKEFVVIYAVGSLILAYDGFVSGVFQIAILNTFVGVMALLIFRKLKNK